MNKRHFLKALGLGSLALMEPGISVAGRRNGKEGFAGPVRHRIWINPNAKDTDAELKQRYADYRAAGIGVVYFEEDSERHFRAAKAAGMEAHRWFWTMNRNEPALREKHPELFSVNRKGESCADKPPYVGYYRFLCPNQPGTLQYLRSKAEEQVAKDYIDGLHLDYVRFVDVILPVNLWAKYNIDQSKELPEYDFCYCKTCRDKYAAVYGKDPLEMAHPDQSPSWRKFRYDSITNIVRNLSDVAHAKKKPVTAAVFPTPEIAKRIVRQDWTNWPLDAVCPMIYHGFYNENVQWIGDAVAEGVNALKGKFPLYAGLFLPDFNGNHDDIRKAVRLAIDNGAAGVSIFGAMTPQLLGILRETAG